MTFYRWRMMSNVLQKVISKRVRKKIFFVSILKVADEKSRVQIRIRKSVVRIRNPYRQLRQFWGLEKICCQICVKKFKIINIGNFLLWTGSGTGSVTQNVRIRIRIQESNLLPYGSTTQKYSRVEAPFVVILFCKVLSCSAKPVCFVIPDPQFT